MLLLSLDSAVYKVWGVQGCMVVVMEWGLGLHLGFGPDIFGQAGMDGHIGLAVS